MPDWGLSEDSDTTSVARRVGDEVQTLLAEHNALVQRWNDPAAVRQRLQELSGAAVRIAAVSLVALLMAVPCTPGW